jgi:MoxR-like ATPase
MCDKNTGRFEYRPGTIMCNLFLADEINRTSPKTQSALLEVMEEGAVTVDGVSHPVPKPFIVMATQNPKGSAGTQLLPESQLDRFMICMSMGYPDMESEIAIAKGKSVKNNISKLSQVINGEILEKLQLIVESTHMHESIYEYICKLVQQTRDNPYVELGISPRGSIACVKMAKAWAFLQGRGYVTPEDVCSIFKDVGKHRIVLNTKARVTHVTEDAVLDQIMSQVTQPASYMEKKGYRD